MEIEADVDIDSFLLAFSECSEVHNAASTTGKALLSDRALHCVNGQTFALGR